MGKIDEIRNKRAAEHIYRKLKKNKPKKLKDDVKEISQHITLIKAPDSLQQDATNVKVLVSKSKSVQNEAMEE